MLTGEGSAIALADPVSALRPRAWPQARLLLYPASLIAGLLLWQAAAIPFSPLVFPPPTSVFRRFFEMLGSGELFAALWTSLGALLAGFGLAAAIGFPLGVALGRVRALSVASEPVMNAVYAVPPAALVPFLIIWFGLYVQSQIALIFIMAVFEIVITMRTGTRTVETRLTDAARAFGCSGFAVLRKVVLPASLPFVLTALRIGFVRALNGMITAQLLLAATGLGALMKQNMLRFDTAGLLAIVALLSLIGLLVQEGLKLLEGRLMPWHIRA
jgi:NitT/TauT family transport system permease protein